MIEITILLVGHYLADFVFQDEYMALNKSNNIKICLAHSMIYSFTMSLFIILIMVLNFDIINTPLFHFDKWSITIFYIATLILHFIVDIHSSKITKYLFEHKKYYTQIPNIGAFSIIGLDQLIHYILLLITFNLIYL